MINGGNATVFVSNMDEAVRFYTQVLDLKLTNRFGNHWATVEAGPGLTIGLHPRSEHYPPPGTHGSIVLGLEVNDSIERVVEQLIRRGAPMRGEIQRAPEGNYAHLTDPDGNVIYLWEVNRAVMPAPEAIHSGARD